MELKILNYQLVREYPTQKKRIQIQKRFPGKNYIAHDPLTTNFRT